MRSNYIFALPKTNGPLVKGLRRIPFTDESRVRFSYGLQNRNFQDKLRIPVFIWWISSFSPPGLAKLAPGLEVIGSYDLVYKWFDYLYTKNIRVAGYGIMPNHVHVMLYFPEMSVTLNAVMANGKRFMAYEIVKRLIATGNSDLLQILISATTATEHCKGQMHKVFEKSFDAKQCVSSNFIYQKLDYSHHNPVSNRWALADNFINYIHSSAGFYEAGLAFIKN